MPVTPRFAVHQDDTFLYVTVHVPWIRVGDAETAVEGCDLSFYCKPYLLKLTLPHEVLDDERATAQYDADRGHGTLVLQFAKATPGLVFPDLDLVTKLLQPRGMPSVYSRGQGATTSLSRVGSGDAVIDLRHVRPAEADADAEVDTGLESRLGSLTMGPSPVPQLDRNSASILAQDGGGRAAVARPLIQVLTSTDADDSSRAVSGGAPLAVHAAAPSPMLPESDLAAATGGASPSPPPGAKLPGSIAKGVVVDSSLIAFESTHQQQLDTPLSALTAVTAAAASAASNSADDVAAVGVTLSADPQAHYGFNRRFCGFFGALRGEFPDLVQLPNPDGAVNPRDRRRQRMAAEDAAWDPERYRGDWEEGGEDPIYQEAMGLSGEWRPWWSSGSEGPSGAFVSDWAWSAEEREAMSSLPRSEYLIDGQLVGGHHASALAATAAPPNAAATLPGLGSAAQAQQNITTTLLGSPAAPTPPVTPKSNGPSILQPQQPLPQPSAALLHRVLDAAQHPERTRLLCGLVGLLGGYAYDVRTTGGEPSCESGWTVCTLSQLLSWLDDECVGEGEEGGSASAQGASRRDGAAASTGAAEALVQDVAVGFVRRALVYPYLRRWDLAVQCVLDSGALLALGRRGVLRALLGVRSRLNAAEPGYLLNRLFVDDYCVWVQGGVSDEELRTLGAGLRGAVGWGGEGVSSAGGVGKEHPLLSQWRLGELESGGTADEGEEEEEEAEEGDSEGEETSDGSESSDANSENDS